MISGVTIGGYHCQNDLGMLLASKVIGEPEPQTNYIEVPGRNGSVDMTEALNGKVAYRDRNIELTFVTCKNISKKNWADFLSSVANALHGRKLEIVFDDDPEWYYNGRCQINSFTTSWGKQTLVLDCVCEPFKYKISDPSETSL